MSAIDGSRRVLATIKVQRSPFHLLGSPSGAPARSRSTPRQPLCSAFHYAHRESIADEDYSFRTALHGRDTLVRIPAARKVRQSAPKTRARAQKHKARRKHYA